MMPNCARKPQLLITILTTAAITGLSGYFLKILGIKLRKKLLGLPIHQSLRQMKLNMSM